MITTIATSAPATEVAPASPSPATQRSVDAFEAAMERQAESGSLPADAGSLERARQGLGLDAAVPAQKADGDMILDGLSHLRSIFDNREARVSELVQRSSLDAASLMSIQLELVNFTLLVDTTSKLTGKSTQVFDTLMKGQ